jgi:PadR family transcriptional regulator PadR
VQIGGVGWGGVRTRKYADCSLRGLKAKLSNSGGGSPATVAPSLTADAAATSTVALIRPENTCRNIPNATRAAMLEVRLAYRYSEVNRCIRAGSRGRSVFPKRQRSAAGPMQKDCLPDEVGAPPDNQEGGRTLLLIVRGNVLRDAAYKEARQREMGEKPSGDVVQGTLDMLILKTLALEPMHGYGIAVRIEQMSKGVFRVNAGSLFVAFKRLQREGLIKSEWQASENNRQAKYYSLTPRGKKQLGREAESWQRQAAAIAEILKA